MLPCGGTVLDPVGTHRNKRRPVPWRNAFSDRKDSLVNRFFKMWKMLIREIQRVPRAQKWSDKTHLWQNEETLIWVFKDEYMFFIWSKGKENNNYFGTSLVAQWLRICLLMQGTRVQALVWEDPTCCRATKPVHHNYWACALSPRATTTEPVWHNYWSPRA